MTRRRRPKADTTADNGGPESAIGDPLSLSEAVALTGFSERTIRRRVAAGELRQRKEGRSAMLSRQEVEGLAARLGRLVEVSGRMADNGRHVADTGGALVPVLERQRQELSMMTAAVLDLNRQLSDQRRLLSSGEAETAREVGELRDRVTRAEVARRWALGLAGGLGVVAVLAVAVLVYVVLSAGAGG